VIDTGANVSRAAISALGIMIWFIIVASCSIEAA